MKSRCDAAAQPSPSPEPGSVKSTRSINMPPPPPPPHAHNFATCPPQSQRSHACMQAHAKHSKGTQSKLALMHRHAQFVCQPFRSLFLGALIVTLRCIVMHALAFVGVDGRSVPHPESPNFESLVVSLHPTRKKLLCCSFV